MTLIDELAAAFLERGDEVQCVVNRITGEVLYDADESLTGEPGIDWDDETSENLLPVPQISSPEAFELRLLFAKKQKPANQDLLKEILVGRKPFRHFKDAIQMLNIDQSWYNFEQAYATEKISEWLKKSEIKLDLL